MMGIQLRLAFVVGMLALGAAAPAGDDGDTGHYVQHMDSQPNPYAFSYTVDDPPSKNFYGHEEKGGDAGGRTEGKYFVLLADGRLMTVSYYVDSKSGFVPKISFSGVNNNVNAFQPIRN